MITRAAMFAAALGISLGMGGNAREIAGEIPAPRHPQGRYHYRRPRRIHGRWPTRQPDGYYSQEVTDTRFMTPRQRMMKAMGDRIIHGQFFGQRFTRE